VLAPVVLSDDIDVNSAQITVNYVGNATNGTAVINPGNTVTFTPATGFTSLASK